VPSVSVRAALVAVESGAADAAIVYRTDARLSTRASIAWLVPADRGPKVVYPAAIVRTSTQPAESQRFIDFLRSAAAASVFERFGFGIAH
jgi:molybdate transport system substrate-binding protein